MMVRIVSLCRVIFCASLASVHLASAQDTQVPAQQSSPPMNSPAPAAGKNSFTESQAKKQMEDAGFQNIKNLKLDSNGVWHATADQNGTPVEIMLDYQGNTTKR